jgi:hypothetical protein
MYSYPLGHAGDVYLRIILFWSIFLPVHHVWSVDAASYYYRNTICAMKKKKDEGNLSEHYHPDTHRDSSSSSSRATPANKLSDNPYSHFSVGTVGMFGHLFLCYVFSAISKTSK